MITRLALLGNHLPRQCGIATFTTHLADALEHARPGVLAGVLAVNDPGRQHAYPDRVRFTVEEGRPDSYRRAADFLNVNEFDALLVQHEYGIYGGKAGAYLIALLRELRLPVLTTLHTILPDPGEDQRAVIAALARASDRIVVMSAAGANLLTEVHGIDPGQIDLIPHGIAEVRTDATSKARLGLAGQTVLLTFGLLSPDKGVEYVIDALPTILAVSPQTVYIVLGATHPHVVDREGEAYRLRLEVRARQLGVADHVRFHNRFVSQAELAGFMAAADIYVTPYLQPAQITSGTLAYAAGAGKAIISTPYAYARELLAGNRGRLVPFRDAEAIAREVLALCADDEDRLSMCLRAREQGRAMSWAAVATRYLTVLDQIATRPRPPQPADGRVQTSATRPTSLPDLSLRHLAALTDDIGLLQHAVFTIPRYADGYCLDDNARALLLMALLTDAGHDDVDRMQSLAGRYLAFVHYAFDHRTSRFRNFLSFDRRWADAQGSDDSHGRAIWALGTMAGRAEAEGRQALARDLFRAALPILDETTSPRCWAYALLGLDEYLRGAGADRAIEDARDRLASRLLALFQRGSEPGWPWFEPVVTYCNARLPQALLVSGARMRRPDMQDAGLRALDWLMSLHGTPDAPFAPIGSNGFFPKGGRPAQFDQQPVEACAATSACIDAFQVSADERWLIHARRAFYWFLGENHLHHSLFDAATGGCRDGLHVDRPNQNQGAEATLSFLLALLDMRRLDPLATGSADVRTVVLGRA